MLSPRASEPCPRTSRNPRIRCPDSRTEKSPKQQELRLQRLPAAETIAEVDAWPWTVNDYDPRSLYHTPSLVCSREKLWIIHVPHSTCENAVFWTLLSDLSLESPHAVRGSYPLDGVFLTGTTCRATRHAVRCLTRPGRNASGMTRRWLSLALPPVGDLRSRRQAYWFGRNNDAARTVCRVRAVRTP